MYVIEGKRRRESKNMGKYFIDSSVFRIRGEGVWRVIKFKNSPTSVICGELPSIPLFYSTTLQLF